MKKHELLIIGGGFGGVYTYLNLSKTFNFKKLNITIVTKSENFTFAPMIVESLGGKINDKDVQLPLGDIISSKHARIVVAEVLSIDLNRQQVHTKDSILQYDYLVMAIGSKTNFYGIDGAEKYSKTLKSLDDATIISNTLLEHKSNKPIKVSIVGAGPTGAELAAKINELTESNQPKPMKIRFGSKVELIDASDRILSYLPSALSIKATKILEQQGIAVRTKASINKVSQHAVHLADGNVIQSDLIIWTAGVQPNLPVITPIVSQHNNQIKTDNYLRVSGYKNVFALGDVASIENNEIVVPMSAQAAVAASQVVAKNISASIEGQDLQAFEYHSKGIFVALGKWKGVGRVAGLNIYGPIVWIGWNFVYVWRFPIVRRRIVIGWRWLLMALS